MLSTMLSFGPLATLLLAALFYLTYVVVLAVFDPLRAIPGPFLARFTRWWYFHEVYRGSFERTDIELHRRHGPVVRIAPGEYSIDDVEGAKTIYGHGNAFVKAPWYWAWMPPDANKASLFADLNPHRHGTQRRKYAAAYSMSSLVGYEPYVDNCTSLLLQRFQEIASSDATIDLGHWLQCYAFDVIGEITFGKRFGFLDMGLDNAGVFNAIEERGRYSTLVGIFPRIHRFLYPLLPKTGGHAYVGNYTLSQMASREKQLKDPNEKDRKGPADFMTRFLTVHEKEPDKMTKGDLFTICQSNIGAGSDTTAITLSATLYHLLKNPESLSRLRAELDQAAKSGGISDPLTFKEAQELKYLQACIKEALRLHPATGLGLQRQVPAGGTTIAGHAFPPGSTLGINAWVAHRNRAVYGSDADDWRPERWLEFERDGRGGEVEKYFFAFGMGSRTCIGKNISLLELQKLVPALLTTFDFELGSGLRDREWRTENMWFVKMIGFETRVTLRHGKKA